MLHASTRRILRLMVIGTRLTVNDYRGIIFIRGGQRSWVVNILQVCGNVISLVECLYMYIYTFVGI